MQYKEDPNSGQTDLLKDREWSNGQPFYVDSEAELALTDVPPLVRQMLDALFVSVFLKKAEVEEIEPGHFARRYTYVNRTVRDRLKWTAEEVNGKPDSEAFSDTFRNPLYETMLKQETDTLNSGASRVMQLEWQPDVDFWRKSKTLEIPILTNKNETGSPIGFCAIAEELEVEMFPFIHSWLREVFNHEYNNMIQGIQADIFSAQVLLMKLKAAGIGTPKAAQLFSDSVANVDKSLENASSRLIVYGRTTVELYKSFSPEHYKLTQTGNDLCKELTGLYEDAPDQISFHCSEDVQDVAIERSAAIKGVLIALVANAVKHASSPQVHVEADLYEGRVRWKVSNPCSALGNGRVKPKTFIERLQAGDGMANLTGAIIGEILSHAFSSAVLGEGYNKIFRFPTECINGWIVVELYSPIKEQR